jgi:hypothetical protein
MESYERQQQDEQVRWKQAQESIRVEYKETGAFVLLIQDQGHVETGYDEEGLDRDRSGNDLYVQDDRM